MVKYFSQVIFDGVKRSSGTEIKIDGDSMIEIIIIDEDIVVKMRRNSAHSDSLRTTRVILAYN